MTFARTALGLAAGPLAWAVHFLAIYAFTGVACARAMPASIPWAIALVTIAAAGVCVAVLAHTLRARESFEHWLAGALAAAALVAIAWEALPVLLVRPCA